MLTRFRISTALSRKLEELGISPVDVLRLAGLTLFLLVCSAQPAPAQEVVNPQSSRQVTGAVTVTNNGISLLPTFTLGKPAVMFDMATGGRRLRFEPQLRFALEWKPWAFIFWWRYKLVDTDRFSVRVGAHPAFAFFREPASTPEGSETMIVRRYVAAEVAPSYSLREGVSVGMYYLFAHGLDEEGTRNTHFLTINASFAHLELSEHVFVKLKPQLYYLRMDDAGGYYATATVSLHHRDFPVSVESILNRSITTDIVTDDDFVWNMSLVYSF